MTFFSPPNSLCLEEYYSHVELFSLERGTLWSQRKVSKVEEGTVLGIEAVRKHGSLTRFRQSWEIVWRAPISHSLWKKSMKEYFKILF